MKYYIYENMKKKELVFCINLQKTVVIKSCNNFFSLEILKHRVP